MPIRRCEEVGVDAFEINFSCPHGMPERKMGMAMGQDESILKVCPSPSDLSKPACLLSLIFPHFQKRSTPVAPPPCSQMAKEQHTRMRVPYVPKSTSPFMHTQ